MHSAEARSTQMVIARRFAQYDQAVTHMLQMCTPLLFSDSAMTGSECDLKEQLAAAMPLDPPSLLKR